jgi:quaternary ammonium compound-resistance protein SugE
MAWVILVAAGLLEIVWATALKQSDGFTRWWPSVIGIGAVGVAIAGIVAFDEGVSAARLLFLSFVVVGIVGLRLVEG